jgi:uncharacterized protein YjbI with pentapeptide repeats
LNEKFPKRRVMSCAYEGCQFLVHDRNLIAFQGEKYCEFHLPLDDHDGNNSVKKAWKEEEIEGFNERILSFVQEWEDENQPVNLGGVVFPGDIGFSKMRLLRADFRKAHFNGVVDFQETVFEGFAIFKNSYFLDFADFQEACFESSADFNGANFAAIASFLETKFNGLADFQNTNFLEFVDFRKVQFSDQANFENSYFSDEVFFLNCYFRRQANFKGTAFGKSIVFRSVLFLSDVDFSTFKGSTDKNTENPSTFSYVTFEETTFKGQVSFVNRLFLTTTTFGQCIFEKAPEFHGCFFHEDTTFPPIHCFLNTKGEVAARRYRALKLAMAKFGAREEEAMFYALEQKSLRCNPHTPSWVKLFSWLYEVTSDYGQSLVRAMVSMTLIFCVFFSTYLFIASPHINPRLDLDWNLITEALYFNINQTIHPFNGLDLGGFAFRLIANCNPSFLEIVSSIQSIFNVVFLGLCLLVLRWRFMRS